MNKILISYAGSYESFVGWHSDPAYAEELDELLREYGIIPFVNHITVNAGKKPPLEEMEPNQISYFGDKASDDTCAELKEKINEQIRRFIKEKECENFEVTKLISKS